MIVDIARVGDSDFENSISEPGVTTYTSHKVFTTLGNIPPHNHDYTMDVIIYWRRPLSWSNEYLLDLVGGHGRCIQNMRSVEPQRNSSEEAGQYLTSLSSAA